MTFNKANWALSSKGFDGNSPSEFKYNGGVDTLAVISASGYFDALRNTADNEVEIGDRITIRAFDLDSLIPIIVTQIDPTIITATVINKDINNNLIVENILIVDDIVEKTLNHGVQVEGSNFCVTGNNVIIQHGFTADNDNNVLMHLQGKRDVDIFIESDTDAVATGDNPVFSLTQNQNSCMNRFFLCDGTGDMAFDVGGAGAPGNTADIVFSTGGEYLTAPAIGTIPDYQGGGKTIPINSLSLRGADQVGQFHVGAEFPTTGGTAEVLDYYEEATVTGNSWTGAFTAAQATNVRFARLGCFVTLSIGAKSAAQNTADTVTLGVGALPDRITPLADTAFPLTDLNDNGTISIGQIFIRANGEVEISLNGGGNFAGVGNLSWPNTILTYMIR